ncbi:uncharacterized protein PGTG_02284 [Puccinia graminis f. sp. tritici CRL 75-36-700-3]|uniref:RNA polymerase II subunit B1 CTD phosphatase RPAP2 homolog n=1 Tax=Puccinia graminis f. sp. tritici (strain CRL 75-36-700-3 / race SCCL) TaxID=418459 RepID=E3JXP8_PUCGT|nr:uncharacterized protein PGTG_02284 [Puccinia graminis f. sp. tritici CRL 75-36-700-3]EFP76823.2 hypothetical protein PGTG_02284 [Puccinia graminis f. sp. tritici CRL 75-36-700-3]
MFSKRESAMDWIVFLTNDNEADRKVIEPDHLKRAVQFISPTDYEEDILIERNLSDLCGYPICLKSPKEAKTTLSPIRRNLKNPSYLQHTTGASSTWKTVTSTTSGSQEQEPRFCSQECQARSDYYLTCILKSPRFRTQNQNNGTSDAVCQRDKKIVLLEELDQIDDRPAFQSSTSAKQQGDTLLKSQALDEDQRTKPQQHNFLEPLLNQFQSHNTTRWVDKNLNPIFSSIQIIEHPPQSCLSPSDTLSPVAPHPSNNQDPDQRFFHVAPSSDCSLSKPSMNLVKPDQDLNPIHELSSSLTQALTSQAILSNSNPHRSIAPKPRPEPKDDDHPTPPSTSESELPAPGLLEAEIIYNVGSVEDQFAIDQAMALRDQLGLVST